ncbi:hypothetical protein DW790_05795 [Firmicutes bacterium AM31-12AC]|nr:hypothetical protein DW790_05795 [Firmicutes bacterium AM31-12AC]
MNKFNNDKILEMTELAELLNKMANTKHTHNDLVDVLTYAIAVIKVDEAKFNVAKLTEEIGIQDIYKKYMDSVDDLYQLPEFNIKDIKMGDKLCIELKGLGSFMATAHRVTANEILFITDEYIASKPMYGLQEWLETSVYDAFPEELKGRVKNLTIPTVGQVFGWDDEWCRKTFVRDNDEQLPLMKERRNRVAYLDNDYEWGWLRNSTKREISSAIFAYVSYYGYANCNDASNSYGVRLEFTLVK